MAKKIVEDIIEHTPIGWWTRLTKKERDHMKANLIRVVQARLDREANG